AALCRDERVIVTLGAQHLTGCVGENQHRAAAAQCGPRLGHHRVARLEQLVIAYGASHRVAAARGGTRSDRIHTAAKTTLPGFLDHRTHAARRIVIAALEARQGVSDDRVLARDGTVMTDRLRHELPLALRLTLLDCCDRSRAATSDAPMHAYGPASVK